MCSSGDGRAFVKGEESEPHCERRRKILESHPEISSLNGHDWRSKYMCIFLVLLPHIGSAVFLAPMFGPLSFLLLSYFVGATLTQALFLAIHEMSHNLFFKSSSSNKAFSIFSNAPLLFPYAISFRKYHRDHHKHQGEEGVDTDLPSLLERKIVTGKFSKSVWCAFQIVAYAIRPVLICPEKEITLFHVLNWAFQACFDASLLLLFGWKPAFYLLLSILLSGGFHPCAGHFLSEHYVFRGRQETVSYYGPLNRITWNVGYHNEHHDFPFVPWSRLPQVRKIASDFYDPLLKCDSWSGIMLDYVLRQDMGPSSRVSRKKKAT